MLTWNGVILIGSDWVFQTRSQRFSSVTFSKLLSWLRTLHNSPKNGISKCWRGNCHDFKTMLTSLNSFLPTILTRNSDYQHVPYSGYYKFLEPAVNLNDPDLIKDVLIKDHFSFHVNEIRFDEKADPLMSLNPFGATHDTWRKARNPIAHSFQGNFEHLKLNHSDWQATKFFSCSNLHRFVPYIHCLWTVVQNSVITFDRYHQAKTSKPKQ